MALTSWKTFDFFDVTQVHPGDEETRSIFENNEITCVSSGTENLFLGTRDGSVHILSPEFKTVRVFKAHASGTEDIPNEPILKVWALDKPVKKTDAPTCLSTLSIRNGRKPFPITAFAVTPDLSQLAIGFGNGSVTVVRGDLVHDRGAKQRTVFESEEPVTGLQLREESRILTLYIATTARILKLPISGRGQNQVSRVVEDSGCAVGCMTLDESNNDIIVVREDAIYYYGIQGRGPCYAFDGPKSHVATFKDYIAIVSPPSTLSKSLARSNNLQRFGGPHTNNIFNTSTLTLLDTGLKFIAHSESLVSQVKFLFIIWDKLFTLTQEGKIYQYHEKPLQQRLEYLYQRNLFVPAINLAQKSGIDESQRNEIFRKYGDFLYQKADYDGAMQQYLKAIDNTEPSQIIRKAILILFTQLHEHHKANSDHTTLLLNCYAKLKDVEKLENFIKSPGALKFDLETAVLMCRQGGYYDQAAYLAEKHGEHEIVVDILIENSKMYPAAVNYISRLEPEAAYTSLMKYARVLLENCPKDTTQLFINYFTGRFRPSEISTLESTLEAPGDASGTFNTVQNLKDLLPLPYMLPSIASTQAQSNDIAATEPSIQKLDPKLELAYDIPRPRQAFSSFVDHPNEFIQFLEACLESQNLKQPDKVDLYTTLFEMYLHKSREKEPGHEEWECKAKNLIEEKEILIDFSNLLLLSHLSNFRDGTILVQEQAGLRFDIFRSFTSAKDTKGAIKALRKYGPQEPQLYPAALAYFASDPQVLEDAGDEFDAVLQKIDEDGLMAPLQVIQTLSTNAVATIGMVKSYLQKTIEREKTEIVSNQRLIDSYRIETAEKRREISDLLTKPQTFSNTRCHACGSQLSLPTVHFLCKHSFHQSCLNLELGQDGNYEGSCPSCKKDNDTIRAIRKAQDESSDRHSMFLDALERSGDRFNTISEFFGRGVMDVATIN
ncbi:vacuolar protein sorting protein (VPS11) [Blumeria hordei DH14]|uniref:E3 ubiquitin-protein ligase PEP5 n=1 Tax=Blumeria graminis f. sp. hordei (strain DH14) TaxID=546991 RepID=N1J926_BLUG1|nr:vacuolar protein sorting protein (VPS11) [Blumeria hordei DH14]